MGAVFDSMEKKDKEFRSPLRECPENKSKIYLLQEKTPGESAHI